MSPKPTQDLTHRCSDAEMREVFKARAQSRVEAAQMEQLKRAAHARFMSDPSATQAEFERLWPQLCTDMAQARLPYSEQVKVA